MEMFDKDSDPGSFDDGTWAKSMPVTSNCTSAARKARPTAPAPHPKSMTLVPPGSLDPKLRQCVSSFSQSSALLARQRGVGPCSAQKMVHASAALVQDDSLTQTE
jgi:hypothetical protein